MIHRALKTVLLLVVLTSGVCAQEERTIIVPDVSRFAGYISCDAETQSEIAVPVMQAGKLLAVLDADSAELDNYDQVDQSYLERLVKRCF